MSRRGCTRRLFFCQKNGKEDLCYGTQNHAKATDKNHIHLQISQQILLGKFAEPKRRYLAQNCYFDAKVEPLWLNNEIYPNGKRSGFQYYEAEKCAEITVLENCFSLCPAGCVSRYNKQGLCVPQKSQSQPKSAASLGAQPPIPRKERCVWGKMFVSPSA